MHFNVEVYVIIIILLKHCTCDYFCLCNYNVEISVYKNADSSETPIGALYEYDCNTLISDGNPLWATIAYHHKVSFVEVNAQTRVQMCHGDVPEADKLLMTATTEMSTIQITTTKATTLATKPSPKTTMSTTTTQATTMSTTPITKTSMSPTITSATLPTTNTPTTKTQSTTASALIDVTTVAILPTTTEMSTTQTTTTQATTVTTSPSPTTTMSTTTTQVTTVITTPIPSTTTPTPLPTTNTPTTTTQSTQTSSTAASALIDGNLDLCNAYIKNDANKNHGFLGQHGSYCYELVDTPTQWAVAENHCKLLLFGNLVHILNQNEQDYLVKFLTSHTYIKSVWIGLTDSNTHSIAVFNSTEGNWKWSSGAPYTYNNFGNEFTSHTDQQHNLHDCAVMHQGGEWSDLPCGINVGILGFGESHPFICQYNIFNSVPNVLNVINEVVG